MKLFRRDYVIIASLAIGFVTSALAWLFLPGFYGASRPWGDYVTIVTDLPANEAEDLLHGSGVAETVSEHSTLVSVSRFASIVVEPLSGALVRLDPRDPRLDEYIDGLMRYFRLTDDDGPTILYAAIEGSLSRAQRLVQHVLGPSSRIAERRPGQMATAGALFLGLAGVILVATMRNARVLLIGAIPWIPVAIGLGAPGAVAASLVFFVWVWAVGDLRVSLNSRIVVLGIVTLLLATSTALLLGIRVLLPMLLAIGGTAALTVGMSHLAWKLHQSREHELFRPVSILPGTLRVYVGRSTFVLLPFLLAASLCLPVLSERVFDVAAPQTATARVVSPRPTEAVSGGAVDWKSLDLLWRVGPSEGLPDLSDFIAHMAYQEGLLFGRTYTFPTPNEQVTITRFSESWDGAYEQFSEVMLSYDETWLQQRLSAVPRGPAAMLHALRTPSGVVLSPERSLYSGHLQLFQHVMFVLLVLAPFLLGGLQWSVPGVRARVLEIARARTKRRRQVA